MDSSTFGLPKNSRLGYRETINYATRISGFSVPGDVVEVRNTGGPPLALDQNGDWTVPWDQWRKGSALGSR
jgi:hypothetical protein